MAKTGFASAGFSAIAATFICVLQPAAAADLQLKAPVLKAPPPVEVVSWSGCYIGGNLGYSWGRARADEGTYSQQVYRAFGLPAQTLLNDTGTVAFGPALKTDVNGWLGGGQIGWNSQQGSWLFGFEADIQATGSAEFLRRLHGPRRGHCGTRGSAGCARHGSLQS